MTEEYLVVLDDGSQIVTEARTSSDWQEAFHALRDVLASMLGADEPWEAYIASSGEWAFSSEI